MYEKWSFAALSSPPFSQLFGKIFCSRYLGAVASLCHLLWKCNARPGAFCGRLWTHKTLSGIFVQAIIVPPAQSPISNTQLKHTHIWLEQIRIWRDMNTNTNINDYRLNSTLFHLLTLDTKSKLKHTQFKQKQITITILVEWTARVSQNSFLLLQKSVDPLNTVIFRITDP